MSYFTLYGKQYHFGWRKNDAAVASFLATLPYPNFDTAAPHLKGTGDGKDVFFWEAEEKALGKQLPVWDQSSLGSCVSHGSGRAAQDLLIVQIALGNPEGWTNYEVAREPIYGGSRVQVGGQQGSYDDGSTGSWAAEWLNKWGIVLYGDGTNGLSGYYDIERCREWGAKGVPDNFQQLAKAHPIKTVTQVTTSAAARDAIANGYPIAICGNISRTMQRDKNGFCPQVGNDWPHSQELCGVCVTADGTPAFAYRNSWGDYLGSSNNQVKLQSGRTITLPAGVYLSDFSSVESDLRQGDSYAYSHAVGWPAQNLTWYI